MDSMESKPHCDSRTQQRWRVEENFLGASVTLSNNITSTLLNSPALRSLGTIPFAVHAETSNYMTFSSVVNFAVPGADGC